MCRKKDLDLFILCRCSGSWILLGGKLWNEPKVMQLECVSDTGLCRRGKRMQRETARPTPASGRRLKCEGHTPCWPWCCPASPQSLGPLCSLPTIMKLVFTEHLFTARCSAQGFKSEISLNPLRPLRWVLLLSQHTEEGKGGTAYRKGPRLYLAKVILPGRGTLSQISFLSHFHALRVHLTFLSRDPNLSCLLPRWRSWHQFNPLWRQSFCPRADVTVPA